MSSFDSYVTGETISTIVGTHVLSIVEQELDYLPFFAAALRRNLANPALPYFPKEVLEQREIVITVERRYTIEQNYDIGSYQRYFHNLRCGNMHLNTDVHRVTIGVENDMDWHRFHKSFEFYPRKYEIDRNPNAYEDAKTRIDAFLDSFEADLPKLPVIREFERKVQALYPNSDCCMFNVDVYHEPEETEVHFYIRKDSKNRLVYTSLDELSSKAVESLCAEHRVA